MDESWRMRMGMFTTPPPDLPNYPPRRSTKDTISDDPLNPEDFTDVFGGPPRTILSHQFFTKVPRSSSSTAFFYEDIFRHQDKAEPAVGRSLQQFSIPAGKQRISGLNHKNRHGFHSDILRWDDERVAWSRSRSKTSTSSALSSEELSPLRPDGYDDVSLFASKLRPINVRSSWKSTRMGREDHQRQQNTPPFAGSQALYDTENQCFENLKNYPFGLSRRHASPETTSLEPISNSSFRVSADDLQLNSPSSAVSSVCQYSDREQKTREIEDEILRQEAMEQEEDEDMSSYVIEIHSDNWEQTFESNDVDEAIAWAKEKFQTHCSESKWGTQECEKEKPTEGNTDSSNSSS